MTRYGAFQTPLGWLGLRAREGALQRVVFLRDTPHDRWADRMGVKDGGERCESVFGLIPQFEAYFAGDRAALAGIQLDLEGSAFQREVWSAVREIPWGETRSYGEIAEAVGRPGAARPVGAANGANPTPIIVPCHRVIGASGQLTGYTGGLDLKVWLLGHEGLRSPQLRLPAL